MEAASEGFFDFFRRVPDHRIERKKLYPVEEILLIAFCGVMAGCDSWEDFEGFGKTRLEALRRYLPFRHGAPSDDTSRRFFRALDPQAFERCFNAWITSFKLDLNERVVAIDGKTSRRSFDGEQRALHGISAYAGELGGSTRWTAGRTKSRRSRHCGTCWTWRARR